MQTPGLPEPRGQGEGREAAAPVVQKVHGYHGAASYPVWQKRQRWQTSVLSLYLLSHISFTQGSWETLKHATKIKRRILGIEIRVFMSLDYIIEIYVMHIILMEAFMIFFISNIHQILNCENMIKNWRILHEKTSEHESHHQPSWYLNL